MGSLWSRSPSKEMKRRSIEIYINSGERLRVEIDGEKDTTCKDLVRKVTLGTL